MIKSLYEAFKEPLIYGDNKLYPIVLKESDDYNDESKTQQNCVKTYIGRPSSIIVSLRKNSITSDERATVEYQIFKKDEQLTFNRPQSLGRFNTRLDETWTPALHLLDERRTKWVKLKDNLTMVKLEKELSCRFPYVKISTTQEEGEGERGSAATATAPTTAVSVEPSKKPRVKKLNIAPLKLTQLPRLPKGQQLLGDEVGLSDIREVSDEERDES